MKKILSRIFKFNFDFLLILGGMVSLTFRSIVFLFFVMCGTAWFSNFINTCFGLSIGGDPSINPVTVIDCAIKVFLYMVITWIGVQMFALPWAVIFKSGLKQG